MAKRRQHGSIQRRTRSDGTVAYYARVQVDGKWLSQTFDSEADAEAWIQRLIHTVRIGPDQSRHFTHWTVAQWVEQYITRGASRWSGATESVYRQRLSSHLRTGIGQEKVIALTTMQVQRWVDGLVSRKYSPSLVHSCAHLLGGAMREAVRLGIRADNPCVNIVLPSMRQRTASIGKTWTDNDVMQIMHVVGNDPFWGAVYRVALGTGMRPGELRALAWSDIDYARRVIHVRRTITRDASGREIVGTTTKTRGKGERHIVVRPAVLTALDGWRRCQQDTTGLVFARDGIFMVGRTWYRYHQALCERAGVPTITLHGLRHSYATIQLNNGVPARVVSEVLGHSTIQQTLDTYVHVTDDMQERASLHLDRLLQHPLNSGPDEGTSDHALIMDGEDTGDSVPD